jgi:hypothetical protein
MIGGVRLFRLQSGRNSQNDWSSDRDELNNRTLEYLALCVSLQKFEAQPNKIVCSVASEE